MQGAGSPDQGPRGRTGGGGVHQVNGLRAREGAGEDQEGLGRAEEGLGGKAVVLGGGGR